MKYKLLLITLLVCGMGWGQIISQYVETNSGTTPKGIEIWNNTGSTLNFSTNNLIIEQGTNGASPSPKVTINNGTLDSGGVIVIGTSDIETYLTGQGLTGLFTSYNFSYNGDDALVVKYGSTTTDIFGMPGSDPGTSWLGSGVNTANQNIELISGITSGASTGWTDPSLRFLTISTSPSSLPAGLAGFGLPPASTTTWSGNPGSWSNGDPTSTVDAIIDGNFSTSGNFICKDLTVNAGATLTINAADKLSVMGDLVNNGSIVFKSDATGSGMFDEFTGTISGVVQVERYIPAKRAFRFLSPSVTTTSSIYENWQENGVNVSGLGTHITGNGGDTNGFDTTATNNPSMFGFDHATGQWTAVTSTNGVGDVLTAGTPYRLMVRGDRTTVLTTNAPTATPTTLRATGALHIGNFTPTLNQTAEGYSFIGNPYQAPIDMKEVLASSSTNMNTDVLYYWDPTINVRGGYVTRTLSDNSNDVTSDFTEILQPGQAVFVKKDNTATAATMTISETNKSVADGAAGVFRNNATQSNTIGVLRANLQANLDNQWQTIDAALALFGDNYSWDVTQEDASKMNNLDEEVSFVQNNTSLAIAKQNDASETDELPIRLQQLRHTNYRWVFDLNNYNGYTPYLLDTEQNTLSVIENGTVLPFTTGSNTSNRFKIVFQNTTLSSPTFDNQISLYPNPSNGANGFYMTNITANAKVTLLTLLGQSVPVSTSLNGTTLQVKPMHDVAKGIYVVQVIAEDGATKQVKWIVE